jgi:putative membrane protein
MIMWGCDYGPMSGGWWGGFFPGSLLGLLLWGLAVFLMVYLAIRIFRPQTLGPRGPSRDRSDSEAILKARFAKGEISREEFVKMRQILSQP